MSDKSEIPAIKNPNDGINWVEEAISKRFIKYYEYKDFHNLRKIGSGSFGKVYCANWKDSEDYFALKSLFNLDNDTGKEIVHEVTTNNIEILYVVLLHLYLIQFIFII